MATLPGSSRAGSEPALVDTTEGPVRGTVFADSVRFLGIPFAAPPVGTLRFRAPQDPARRNEVLDASEFAAAPIQNPPPPGLYGPGEMPTSEDCLALNIWRPLTPGPHPVYVWVHGGGNVAGSSRMPVFDGSRFAREGIVCVTISYRVGALGFLDVSPILGSDYAGSGNNGMLDIVAALRWVRANIARFDGDPAAVTVGGQSAGAKNVCTLLAMSAPRGLFRAAIVESGGAETINTLAGAREMAAMFAQEIGKDTEIGMMPAADLLAAQNRVSKRWPRKYPFRPVIDGVHLDSLPLEMMRVGTAAPVPLLIGTTRDENAFFGPAPQRDGEVTQHDLANIALDAFAPVYAHYASLMPTASATDRRYAAITAAEYEMPTIRAAQSHGSHRPTWCYRLDMPRATAPHAGYAVHGSELPLVWDKQDDPQSAVLGPEGEAARRLGAMMHAHWISFIREGQPDIGQQPDWPRYDAASRATMLFDASSRVAVDPSGRERRLWEHARFDFQ